VVGVGILDDDKEQWMERKGMKNMRKNVIKDEDGRKKDRKV
jgi:hypothetical protein